MKKILLLGLICLTTLFVKAQVSYCDNFESGAPGWYATSTSGSVWQLDSLSGSGGNHVWGIGLDTNYAANTTTFLYTPAFDFSASIGRILCFCHKYQTEIYQDGMRVEYSLDSLNWAILGNAGMGPTWYNSFFISSSGNLPGWSGNLPIWQNASISLVNQIGFAPVYFRFVFTSDSSGNMNGYIIDNFCIWDSLSGNCNNNNCSDLLGITESSFKNEPFIIYPNPANDQVIVEMKKNSPYGKIVLFDIMGKEILNQKISNTITFVDVKNISDGVYFISVENDGNIVRKKIIVLH